ncbi:MAG TPA: glycosyltransferase family 2 protein [Casimicrobiaceae bacterium]|nr:glycosyltransferase family 2 protein [Casimicrobiaceae bacterium]
MASHPWVWIIVLNWNGLADTLACLESLRRLRYEHHRVVVVDNGSTDGSVEALRGRAAELEIELIDAGRNLGYAGGNNVGIRRALDGGADFILVLNNDTVVDPGLLDELLAAAERNPTAGCFGPWILYLSDPERIWFSGSAWDADAGAFTARGKGKLASELSADGVDTAYVCGAALFVRARVPREIGLFDERFFLVYEDSDWCFRARRAGWSCMMVPGARVWHRIGTSFGSEASPLRTYFSTRNKLLWAEKNARGSEWRRALYRAVRRLVPRVAVERRSGTPAHKALLWACASFGRDWSIKCHNSQEIAQRRAVADYLARRFGDCPPRIRALTQGWTGVGN